MRNSWNSHPSKRLTLSFPAEQCNVWSSVCRFVWCPLYFLFVKRSESKTTSRPTKEKIKIKNPFRIVNGAQLCKLDCTDADRDCQKGPCVSRPLLCGRSALAERLLSSSSERLPPFESISLRSLAPEHRLFSRRCLSELTLLGVREGKRGEREHRWECDISHPCECNISGQRKRTCREDFPKHLLILVLEDKWPART